MNTKLSIRAALFSACLLFVGAAHAVVGTIAVGLGRMNQDIGEIQTSFSADAVVETEEMNATGRVYYQPGKVRDEMNFGGQQMVTIRLLDENKVLMLMGNGMYTETAADQQNERAPDYKLISREMMGPETVNGIPTIKYKSVYEGPDGKFGGFTWYSEDNIAVKGFLVSESEGEKQRIKYEFTSLQRGPQDDALFRVPPGSQKFDMGAFAGMQGMGGMGSMGAPGTSPGGAAAAGQTPPPQAPAGPESTSTPENEDAGFVGEVAEETEETVKDETKRSINDAVRKGLGGLFGR